MLYFLAIIAGLIQGITEFLPISSSGHLVLFHDILNFNLPDNMLFDVMLHFGTLLAVLIFFHHDIAKIIRGFLSSLTNWNLVNNYNQRLAWLIIVAILPAGLAGFFFENIIEEFFRSSFIVAIMMILVGLLFFWVEKHSEKSKEISQLTKIESFKIGLAQVAALIPGTSRSGITIIAGLMNKMKREEAAKFSFLMSAPVIFGASVKKLFDISSWASQEILLVALGFLAAFISGYISIRFLMKFLSNHSLNFFAWYRLIIGCLILLLLLLQRGM